MTTLSKYEEGQLLLIDKPFEWTSFDVVKKLRSVLRVKKIGHAGTLDPLATGLLLIATGKFTKKLQFLQAEDKEYEGVIEVGKTTPSYDLETAFDTESKWEHISDEDLLGTAHRMTGMIEQYPPAHSAVKVGGQRAYKRARANQEVVLKPRDVMIHRFELTRIAKPEVSFQIHCSKGTYIRSMANDFGRHLGTGAYLKSLRRTAIGDYRISDARALQDFIADYQKEHASH
ncbi:MAG: tRNA pseudouridine(55) synthase TruB [Bacteroidota bacterium]